MVNICGDKEIQSLIAFILCLSFSRTHSSTYRNLNSTLDRVKKQASSFPCSVNQFRCNNNDCIEGSLVCNGGKDCADGADESEKQCAEFNCPSNLQLIKCKYGACIHKSLRCNGIGECADGSDEDGCPLFVSSQISNKSSTETLEPIDHGCLTLKHPPNGKRSFADSKNLYVENIPVPSLTSIIVTCNSDYRNADLNSEGDAYCFKGEWIGDVSEDVCRIKSSTETLASIDDGCLTLKHPLNGKRSFTNNKPYVENIPVPSSTIITITCNSDYRATDLHFDGEAYCSQGKWVGDTSADICKKICPPLNDSRIIATCIYNSRNVACAEAVEGTTATTECKPFFTYPTQRSKITCKNGSWTPNLDSCTPECGINIVNAEIINIFKISVLGEHPWIVAVYKDKEHICAGSIITQKYVLSAAHCFTHAHTGMNYNKDDFLVIAGKFFRDFKDESDEPAKQIDQLHIHPHYRGRLLNYQYNIAMLKVREFTLGLFVQLVCIDWIQTYEETSLQEGNNGVVVGWELHTQDDDPDQALKKVILPFQPKRKCREHLPDDFFQLYYTPDKICGVYINNGTKSCRRSSGGGYYFQSDSRFYLRGIVSLAPADGRCAKNLYALHTNVSVYIDWITDVIGTDF